MRHNPSEQSGRDERFYCRVLRWLVLCFAAMLVTGCRGCQRSDNTNDDTADQNQKKDEDRKPPFEIRSTRIVPGDRNNVSRNYVKPGHWMVSKSILISNYRDFNGTLVSKIQGDKGIAGESIQRIVSLPKETSKIVESTFHVPSEVSSSTVKLSKNLIATGGRSISTRSQTVRVMKDYQYLIVCLSDQPDRHRFWESVDCVALPKASYVPQSAFRSYFVINNEAGRLPPLPDHALNWTTIAYVIWNDYSTEQLSSQQQAALLDWLHWGGQLIISGPDAMTQLRGSFLEPYLPAVDTESFNLGPGDFETINASWSLKSSKENALTNNIVITDKNKLAGIKLNETEDARFVEGTGELVVEKSVGRGRIVITAFQLNAPTINTWRGFSSFVNGALFLRPNRKFYGDDNGQVKFRWQSVNSDSEDCMLASTLRFCSRDLGRDGTTKTFESTPQIDLEYQQRDRMRSGLQSIYEDDYNDSFSRTMSRDIAGNVWYYGGFNSVPKTGTSAINHTSAIPLATRDVLVDVAGIRPPLRSFVIKSMAIYLMFLVPVNWMIFRLIRKTEWAWVAAPIISITGAFVVIRAASLDIGFARSQSDVALVEIYAGHSRGHHARFSALYTSLSTNYSVENETDGAISIPFEEKSNSMITHSIKEQGRVLERFHVESNRARLLRQESFIELGGTIDALVAENKWRISNGTEIDIQEAAVIRRDENGIYHLAWIGKLDKKSTSQELIWKRGQKSQMVDFWIDSKVMYSGQRIAAEQFKRKNIDPKNDWIAIEQLELPAELMNAVNLYLEQTEKAARSNGTPKNGVEIDRNRIRFEALSLCLQQYLGQHEVHLGRIVDAIENKLQLARGQSRMLGWTDKLPTKMNIEPYSERQKNKSLLLVHLTPGVLPTAQPDVNLSFDFVGKTGGDEELGRTGQVIE